MNLQNVKAKAAGFIRSVLKTPAKTPLSGAESKPVEPVKPTEIKQ
jgi:hypothetical protein